LYKELTGFATLKGADDAGKGKLLHDTSGAVISDGELALDEGGGGLLLGDDEAGGVVE
jgi:hypothetical protein